MEELKLRLAPFHHDDSFLTEEKKQRGFLQNLITEGGTYPNFKANHPFTDTTNILPNCEHSHEMCEVANLDGIMKIWVAAATGLASSEYKNELKEIGITNQIFDYSENQISLYQMVVKGVQRSLIAENAVFPFNLAKTQLDFYRSIEFSHWKEAVLVIVGESLEDFCLYFCLSRMRSKVAWLLPSWLPENLESKEPLRYYENIPIGYFARALRDLEWENQNESATHFLSISMPSNELENVREVFRTTQNFTVGEGLLYDETEPKPEGTEINLSKSIGFLLRYPSRLFEVGNFDKIISKHFINSNMAGFFEPPKPKNFSKIDLEHRWISDFSIVNHQYPRHPSLGKEIIRDPLMFHSHARVGKDSIAFADPRSGYITEDIDSWLRKPEIHLPTTYEIFDLLFQKCGYKTDISDKGRFALSTISKFGNLSNLANFLRTIKKKVFDRYTLSEKENPRDKGLFLKTDRRWYLNFETFLSILEADVTASALIYHLISISVLYRGLIFKCQLCRNTDWYSITEFSNEFQCKRCNLKQNYSQSHSLNQLEPNWYYKLDEVVYQAIIHNSIVPILAVYYLMLAAKTFDYIPEVELRSLSLNKQILELDICCIQDGKITIGEAKTANCLANSKKEENAIITKYFDLSKNIGANQVVFATSSENWQKVTQERILKRFSNSPIKIIFITRKELLGN